MPPPDLHSLATCTDARVHDAAWPVDVPFLWVGGRQGLLCVHDAPGLARVLRLYANDPRTHPSGFSLLAANTVWGFLRAGMFLAAVLREYPGSLTAWCDYVTALEDVQAGSSALVRYPSDPETYDAIRSYGPMCADAASDLLAMSVTRYRWSP